MTIHTSSARKKFNFEESRLTRINVEAILRRRDLLVQSQIVDLLIEITSNNPGFLKLLKVTEDLDFEYEFVDGINLSEFLKLHPRYFSKNRQRIELLIQKTLNPLKILHRNSLVHCDVTLANYLAVVENDEIVDIYLGDYDLVLKMGINNLHNADLLGTLNFISPEQSLCKDLVEPSRDIYSLGITLGVLLTGIDPEDYTERSDMRDDILAQLENDGRMAITKALTRATEYYPHNRFQTVEDFQHELITAVEIDFPDEL